MTPLDAYGAAIIGATLGTLLTLGLADLAATRRRDRRHPAAVDEAEFATALRAALVLRRPSQLVSVPDSIPPERALQIVREVICSVEGEAGPLVPLVREQTIRDELARIDREWRTASKRWGER